MRKFSFILAAIVAVCVIPEAKAQSIAISGRSVAVSSGLFAVNNFAVVDPCVRVQAFSYAPSFAVVNSGASVAIASGGFFGRRQSVAVSGGFGGSSVAVSQGGLFGRRSSIAVSGGGSSVAISRGGIFPIFGRRSAIAIGR